VLDNYDAIHDGRIELFLLALYAMIDKDDAIYSV
tara:strand:+ start:182 stop:283 length:102 start_codon:yes stop_codon:yes gene_type:complete